MKNKMTDKTMSKEIKELREDKDKNVRFDLNRNQIYEIAKRSSIIFEDAENSDDDFEFYEMSFCKNNEEINTKKTDNFEFEEIDFKQTDEKPNDFQNIDKKIITCETIADEITNKEEENKLNKNIIRNEETEKINKNYSAKELNTINNSIKNEQNYSIDEKNKKNYNYNCNYEKNESGVIEYNYPKIKENPFIKNDKKNGRKNK